MRESQNKIVPAAADVMKKALELGADLVGIASAKILNAYPPDPKYPQTPERISPRVKSIIVIAQHIPAAVFRCKKMVPVQYMDMIVLRRMDKVGGRLAMWLEEKGHPSFIRTRVRSRRSVAGTSLCWRGLFPVPLCLPGRCCWPLRNR